MLAETHQRVAEEREARVAERRDGVEDGEPDGWARPDLAPPCEPQGECADRLQRQREDDCRPQHARRGAGRKHGGVAARRFLGFEPHADSRERDDDTGQR